MDRGPLACTDAERRAARAHAAALRAVGRPSRLEARWVRPGWPAWQGLCAAGGVVAAVVSVDHDLVGLVVAGAATAVSAAHGRGRLPLGRARATQDVVAPAREPAGRAAVVVLAAVDRPRAALLARVPEPIAWVVGALVASTALAAARVAGATGTPLAVAQLVVALVLLVAAAALLEAAWARPERADAAATDAAIAVAAAAPWADVVLVGAGELGLRARLRAERRAPEELVLIWLEPGPAARWRTAHPALAEIAGAQPGVARARGRALPAGAYPALLLAGPADELAVLALAVAERVHGQLGAPAVAK